ncbi:MAG: hypothetical protein D5R99_04530 [Methanocalculus sp. MSAO_Arc1]|uniref:HEAT repeat domain-containing protein n=1 Tax=Methanocalculus TaxID=71151 RepID=UPI000FEE1FB1|nr:MULTISPECIES: HEAT repeat domain-containing protein [unclassified Methanocalculus]MCP1662451.1 HEAT repeat protein [Methanocalculus sp. AMF5]RQD80582.1 MAG: hypothetical protein D5R99_04530 [Methanocalculus sp. MSAO_Arc1]
MVLNGFFGSNIQRLAERKKYDKLASMIVTAEPEIKREAALALAGCGDEAYEVLGNALEDLLSPIELNVLVRDIYNNLRKNQKEVVIFLLHAPEIVRNLVAKEIISTGVPDLATIHRFSKNSDPILRRAAVATADHLGKEGFDIVLSGLFDRDPDVAREAADIFEKRKNIPESPKERAQYLYVREKWHELSQMGKHGKPILLRLLKDGSNAERRAVIKALGKGRDPDMVKILQRQLNDPDPLIVAESIAAIATIGGPEAERTLVACLRASYPLIRMESGWGLQRMGWKPDTEEDKILLFFATENWKKLADIGKAAIPVLVYALREEHSAVRANAIETLRLIGPLGIAALRQAAGSRDAALARQAKLALLEIEKKEAELLADSQITVDDSRYKNELQASLKARSSHVKSLSKKPPGAPPDKNIAVPKPVDPALEKKRYREELQDSLRAREEHSQTVPPKQTKSKEKDPATLPDDSRTNLELNDAILGSLNEALRKLYGEAGQGRGLIDTTVIEPLRKKDDDMVVSETHLEADPDPTPQPSLWKEDDEKDEEKGDNFMKLVASLSDRDPNIRVSACYALRLHGERAVDPLISALRDSSLLVRAAAAESLGEIADPRAKLFLLKLTRDEEPDVRIAAILALGYLPDAEIVSVLITLLGDDHFRVATAAVDALVRMGHTALPYLIKALDDQNILIRTNAAAALGRTEDPFVIPILVRYLEDPIEEMRIAIARALARFGLEAIPPLQAILQDGSRLQKLTVLDTFGRMSEDEATTAIRPALGDPDQSVRLYALRMLRKRESLALWREAWADQLKGDVPKPKGIPRLKKEDKERYVEGGGEDDVHTLIEGLKDNNRNVQFASAMKLTVMGRSAIDELLKAIKSESPELRSLAEEVIGEMREVAVEPLLDALYDESPVIRAVASRNLGRIGGSSVVGPLTRALETDEDDEVRAIIVEALGYIGTPEAADPIIRSLQDREENVRMVAARTLGYMNDPSATKALINALEDTDLRVRDAALQALHDPDGTPREHLVRALTDESGTAGPGVSDALKAIGWTPETEEEQVCFLISQSRWFEVDKIGKSALKPIRETLEKGSVEARIEAIKTIGRLHDPEAITLLIDSLADENLMIRKRAEYALVDIGLDAVEPLTALLGKGTDQQDTTIQRILRRIEARPPRELPKPEPASEEEEDSVPLSRQESEEAGQIPESEPAADGETGIADLALETDADTLPSSGNEREPVSETASAGKSPSDDASYSEGIPTDAEEESPPSLSSSASQGMESEGEQFWSTTATQTPAARTEGESDDSDLLSEDEFTDFEFDTDSLRLENDEDEKTAEDVDLEEAYPDTGEEKEETKPGEQTRREPGGPQ